MRAAAVVGSTASCNTPLQQELSRRHRQRQGAEVSECELWRWWAASQFAPTVVCAAPTPAHLGCHCMLQCVAVWCSVVQCVAVCCSVLQCVAVCCSVLQCVAVCCGVLQCVAVCCSVLQCVALCCSVLQCVAVCCSVMQHLCIHAPLSFGERHFDGLGKTLQPAAHCNTLQHTATHCNTLQHTATHCSTVHRTVTHCNTLQHTATHCNTLQHTATQYLNSLGELLETGGLVAHYNTRLQHTATHCNTLQHSTSTVSGNSWRREVL